MLSVGGMPRVPFFFSDRGKDERDKKWKQVLTFHILWFWTKAISKPSIKLPSDKTIYYVTQLQPLCLWIPNRPSSLKLSQMISLISAWLLPSLPVMPVCEMNGLRRVWPLALQQVPLVVLLADVDALGEVTGVRDGLQKVILHQAEVVQLGRAGRTSLGTLRVKKHLVCVWNKKEIMVIYSTEMFQI